MLFGAITLQSTNASGDASSRIKGTLEKNVRDFPFLPVIPENLFQEESVTLERCSFLGEEGGVKGGYDVFVFITLLAPAALSFSANSFPMSSAYMSIQGMHDLRYASPKGKDNEDGRIGNAIYANDETQASKKD